MNLSIILGFGAAIAGAQTMAALDPVAFRMPTVTLRVTGDAVVDRRSLLRSRAVSQRESDPCQGDREPAELWVRIIPGAASKR